MRREQLARDLPAAPGGPEPTTACSATSATTSSRRRDAIRNLAGLSRGAHEYLRDVGDHLEQIAGELHRQVEDLMSLAQTYFNANADRLNAVATRLTVMGTLFLTWTLVTGFFGQNFGWLVNGLDTRGEFLLYGVGGLLVPSVVLLGLFWVKRRDWF